MFKKLLGGAVLICGLGAYLGYKAFQNAVYTPFQITQPVIFDLPKGSSTDTLANILHKKGLVSNKYWVILAARIYGMGTKFKAGEYEATPSTSLKDLLEKIVAGNVVMHKITLPEGLTVHQTLEILDNNAFLNGKIRQEIPEGSLLPETYAFAKGTDKTAIIKKSQTAMQQALDDAWASKDADLPLQNKEELLILASIIEKETGLNTEREKVASVFVNRLRMNMPLQTDPTVIYAITLGKTDLERSLTRKDLSIESAYNTYKIRGLPPTPICNPGLKSLQAAAHPAQTDYLYFVANGQGGHNFAKTLAEHNKNVQTWLKLKKLNQRKPAN